MSEEEKQPWKRLTNLIIDLCIDIDIDADMLHSRVWNDVFYTRISFLNTLKIFGFCHCTFNHIQSFIYGWIDFFAFYLLSWFFVSLSGYLSVSAPCSTSVVAGVFSISWPSNAAIKIVFPVKIDFKDSDMRCMDLWYYMWNTRISSLKLFMECSNKSEEIKSGASDKGMGANKGDGTQSGKSMSFERTLYDFPSMIGPLKRKENSITCHAICRYYKCRISMSINWFSSSLNWFCFLIAFSRKKSFLFLGLPHEEKLHRIFPCWIAWNRKIITIDLDVFFHLYKTTQRDSFGTYTYRIPNITNKQKKVDMLSDFVCVCALKKVCEGVKDICLWVRLHLKFKLEDLVSILGLNATSWTAFYHLVTVDSGEQMWFLRLVGANRWQMQIYWNQNGWTKIWMCNVCVLPTKLVLHLNMNEWMNQWTSGWFWSK